MNAGQYRLIPVSRSFSKIGEGIRVLTNEGICLHSVESPKLPFPYLCHYHALPFIKEWYKSMLIWKSWRVFIIRSVIWAMYFKCQTECSSKFNSCFRNKQFSCIIPPYLIALCLTQKLFILLLRFQVLSSKNNRRSLPSTPHPNLVTKRKNKLNPFRIRPDWTRIASGQMLKGSLK